MTYPNYPQYQQYMNPYQYQQQMQPSQPVQAVQPTQIAQQPQAINQGLLWVQGEAGAKSYMVAPNTTVLLMDSEGTRFYLKSTDNAGMPNLRTFEYTEIVQNTPQSPQIAQADLDNKYVTRAEYDGLKRQYEEILDRLDNISSPGDGIDQPKATTQTSKRGRGGNDNG